MPCRGHQDTSETTRLPSITSQAAGKLQRQPDITCRVGPPSRRSLQGQLFGNILPLFEEFYFPFVNSVTGPGAQQVMYCVKVSDSSAPSLFADVPGVVSLEVEGPGRGEDD